MATEIIYPLKQVLEVKQKRVDDAEKVVNEKLKALEKEQEILKQKEADRDKAKKHYEDKLKQMRKLMDEGTTSPKILQMKAYLKVAKERVTLEEKKVVDQKKQVETAEKNLEAAKATLKLKRLEVDKLQSHRVDWTKEMRKELDVIEAREQDELGSVMYTTRSRKK